MNCLFDPPLFLHFTIKTEIIGVFYRALSYGPHRIGRTCMVKSGLVYSSLAAFFMVALKIAPGDDNKPSGYVGSGECRFCHAEQYQAWESSRHAKTLVPTTGAANLPLDIAAAPGNLQDDLRNADFMTGGTYFIKKDPAGRHYKMLEVRFDSSSGSYKPSDLKLDWSDNCAGCHTTNVNEAEKTWNENGVGCEACHGPGHDHVAGKGDASKIVSSNAADVCGQCHSGNLSGSGLMSDGTRWIVGYRPGMELSSLPGLQTTSIDPGKLPPPPVNNHPLTYNMWKASGHGRNTGRDVTIGGKGRSGPVSCIACHNPHQSKNPSQLVADRKNLCEPCHSQHAVLKGKGAKGVEDTRNLHTAIACVECHMTEKNHLMKVLRPDNPELTEDRTDTCSACHEVKDRKIRAHQIQDWESWYREGLDPIQADLKTIDIALNANPDLLNPELRKKLADVKDNLSIIINDGSGGVHNLDYALEIMALARKHLKEIKTGASWK
jgi:predicted CXXCH cytochrome family protein